MKHFLLLFIVCSVSSLHSMDFVPPLPSFSSLVQFTENILDACIERFDGPYLEGFLRPCADCIEFDRDEQCIEDCCGSETYCESCCTALIALSSIVACKECPWIAAPTIVSCCLCARKSYTMANKLKNKPQNLKMKGR